MLERMSFHQLKILKYIYYAGTSCGIEKYPIIVYPFNVGWTHKNVYLPQAFGPEM